MPIIKKPEFPIKGLPEPAKKIAKTIYYDVSLDPLAAGLMKIGARGKAYRDLISLWRSVYRQAVKPTFRGLSEPVFKKQLKGIKPIEDLLAKEKVLAKKPGAKAWRGLYHKESVYLQDISKYAYTGRPPEATVLHELQHAKNFYEKARGKIYPNIKKGTLKKTSIGCVY